MNTFLTIYDNTIYLGESPDKLSDYFDDNIGNIYYANLDKPTNEFKIWSGTTTEILLQNAILKNGEEKQVHRLFSHIWREGLLVSTTTETISEFDANRIIHKTFKL